MSAPLEALESVLEMLIEDCRQLGIIVSDFQSESQTTLDQKINHIVTLMQEVDRFKPEVQDIQVPLEVFDYIDHGRKSAAVYQRLPGRGADQEYASQRQDRILSQVQGTAA
ncbi:hypothetical protein MRX96_015878 [Rhipicephalus microplus]